MPVWDMHRQSANRRNETKAITRLLQKSYNVSKTSEFRHKGALSLFVRGAQYYRKLENRRNDALLTQSKQAQYTVKIYLVDLDAERARIVIQLPHGRLG